SFYKSPDLTVLGSLLSRAWRWILVKLSFWYCWILVKLSFWYYRHSGKEWVLILCFPAERPAARGHPAVLPPALISYTINTLLLCSCPPCVFPVRGVIERSFLAFLFSGVFEHVNPFSKRAGNCAQMVCGGCRRADTGATGYACGQHPCRQREPQLHAFSGYRRSRDRDQCRSNPVHSHE